jgi:hypothetical protein
MRRLAHPQCGRGVCPTAGNRTGPRPSDARAAPAGSPQIPSRQSSGTAFATPARRFQGVQRPELRLMERPDGRRSRESRGQALRRSTPSSPGLESGSRPRGGDGCCEGPDVSLVHERSPRDAQGAARRGRASHRSHSTSQPPPHRRRGSGRRPDPEPRTHKHPGSPSIPRSLKRTVSRRGENTKAGACNRPRSQGGYRHRLLPGRTGARRSRRPPARGEDRAQRDPQRLTRAGGRRLRLAEKPEGGGLAPPASGSLQLRTATSRAAATY